VTADGRQSPPLKFLDATFSPSSRVSSWLSRPSPRPSSRLPTPPINRRSPSNPTVGKPWLAFASSPPEEPLPGAPPKAISSSIPPSLISPTSATRPPAPFSAPKPTAPKFTASIVVTKFGQLFYATRLDIEPGRGAAIDASSNIYRAGSTFGDPTPPCVFRSSGRGFLAKYSPDDNSFLGHLLVDAAGALYLPPRPKLSAGTGPAPTKVFVKLKPDFTDADDIFSTMCRVQSPRLSGVRGFAVRPAVAGKRCGGFSRARRLSGSLAPRWSSAISPSTAPNLPELRRVQLRRLPLVLHLRRLFRLRGRGRRR